MAVSVIDTRGEFKLVQYSGDDEHWPQWVLKCEAWRELVGWGRQLDAAAASTLPIVNTTLETEVQTISRQLYAILVVKLEGKALGIVKLVNKGKPHLLDRRQWMSIRLVQCLDSRLARTGKGNRRDRARARMARAMVRARKVTRARIRSRYPNLSNSKDTAGIATNGDTSALTAGNASPTPSRKVVRQLSLLTVETSQP